MSDSSHSSQHNANWIDAWLDTQRGWLGRWQALAMEQRVDMTRETMETLRRHFDPANPPPEALNVVLSFQALLQSCLAHVADAARQSGDNAQGAAANTLWQQWFTAIPFGYARESQLAWQEHSHALADYQLRQQAVLTAFATVFAKSLDDVPRQVAARQQAGAPVTGFRELYELWIESGERAFADLAHDEGFIAAQAASGNALSRLKRAQQVLIEQWLKSHDLPTRAELNMVHQRMRAMTARIAELEGQLAASPPRGSPT